MNPKKSDHKDSNEIIAEAIFDLSKSIRLLGMGNVDRGDKSPGAIEDLATFIRDSNREIASALDGIADAIHALAEAIEKSK